MVTNTVPVTIESEECLSECSSLIGNQAKMEYYLYLMENIKLNKIISPIEQLIYIALETLVKINNLTNIRINIQYPIGKYRVDFLLNFFEYPDIPQKVLIIECDSQEWHERTEKERRYEKRRDRFLTSKGYKFLHFTGKEIKDDPLKIAQEILKSFTNLDIRRS